MGKRSDRHRTTSGGFNNNFITASSSEGSANMLDSLDNLCHKRGSTREEALSSIIGTLTTSCKYQFAETNFATLLYGCLNCFKKGSLKESCLASQALGLLAITTGCGNNAHELYKESLSALSPALKSKSEPAKLISILDCLAIVTFVCGNNNSLETERTMEIIWDFIHSESVSNVVASKHLVTVQAAAISAWSLLLTTIEDWMLNVKYWERAISFILDLLETDDVSIGIAASEALAVIVEMGYLEKFVRGSKDSSVDKENSLRNEFSSIEESKGNILSRVRSLFLQAEVEELANKAARENCLKVFEDDFFPETSVKIGKHKLTLNTWSQLLQMNFLKRLLGAGFVRHMLENELLHGVFDFTPKAQRQPADKLYVAEREDVIVRRFVPEVRRHDCKDTFVRMTKSSNSVYSKASTQLLSKQRDLREAELRSICVAIDEDLELA